MYIGSISTTERVEILVYYILLLELMHTLSCCKHTPAQQALSNTLNKLEINKQKIEKQKQILPKITQNYFCKNKKAHHKTGTSLMDCCG